MDSGQGDLPRFQGLPQVGANTVDTIRGRQRQNFCARHLGNAASANLRITTGRMDERQENWPPFRVCLRNLRCGARIKGGSDGNVAAVQDALQQYTCIFDHFRVWRKPQQYEAMRWRRPNCSDQTPLQNLNRILRLETKRKCRQRQDHCAEQNCR